MPVLEILSGEREGAVIAVDGDEFFIGNGKDETCQVKLADAGISRKHARFARKPDGGWTVEDLGSSNGTFVNFTDLRKKPEKGPSDLADKDILFIGRTVAKFWVTAKPAGAAATAPVASGPSLSREQLRDLARGCVPIKGLSCPACRADLERDLVARIRQQEQVEILRRLGLHTKDQGEVDRLVSLAKK